MPTDRTSLVLVSVLTFMATICSAMAYGSEGIEGKTLSVFDCISIGVKQNPAAEIAEENLKIVAERIDEARGGYYPSIKLAASYTYTDQQKVMPLGPDVYDTRFLIRQTLFDAGATSNLVRSITQSVTAQKYDVKRTVSDIVLNVRTAYYDVLKKKELVDVAKTALNTTEKHLAQSQELYREGVAPRSDVIKSQVQVSTARLEFIKANNALLTAKSSLATAMGQPVTTAFDVAAQKASDQMPALPPFNEAMMRAFSQRPELKGTKAKIESAESSLDQARSGFYPNINLDASYGWQENTFSPNEKKWSVGVTIGLPLFEQLTTRSKVRQALANLDGLRATELQTKRSIELELEQAWLSLKEAGERLTVTIKAMEQAGEDMSVSEGRYREGVGNILEVIDAQTALTQAETNRVIAYYDIALANARLDRALGNDVPEDINL